LLAKKGVLAGLQLGNTVVGVDTVGQTGAGFF
jgi:hypothetical protein